MLIRERTGLPESVKMCVENGSDWVLEHIDNLPISDKEAHDLAFTYILNLALGHEREQVRQIEERAMIERKRKLDEDHEELRAKWARKHNAAQQQRQKEEAAEEERLRPIQAFAEARGLTHERIGWDETDWLEWGNAYGTKPKDKSIKEFKPLVDAVVAEFNRSGLSDELEEALEVLKAYCTHQGEDLRDRYGNHHRIIANIFDEAVDKQIEEKAREIGMEWTAELLTTTFAMPDGTRVKWGEATLEQHRTRSAQLAKNASRNLEAATRHRVAINTIAESGASCLNEVQHG